MIYKELKSMKTTILAILIFAFNASAQIKASGLALVGTPVLLSVGNFGTSMALSSLADLTSDGTQRDSFAPILAGGFIGILTGSVGGYYVTKISGANQNKQIDNSILGGFYGLLVGNVTFLMLNFATQDNRISFSITPLPDQVSFDVSLGLNLF